MLITLITLSVLLLAGVLFIALKLSALKTDNSQQELMAQQLMEKHHEQRAQLDKHCLTTSQTIQSSVTQQMSDLCEQIQGSLEQQ